MAAYTFLKKMIRGNKGYFYSSANFVAKLLKTIEKKMKKQTESASRVVRKFDSCEPRAIGLEKDMMSFCLSLAHVR